MTKRLFQWTVVLMLLAASFTSTGSAMAWSGCASYITVQWGDTLSGIASYCGTTAEAIQAANPGLGWWLYAGQVLYIPSGYMPAYTPTSASTYVVQWGDSIGGIAARMGYSVNDILAVNPQIWNPSWIYAGQIINLPAASSSSGTYYNTQTVPVYPAPSTGGAAYSNIKVTNKKGLLIRTGPGTSYPKIESEVASAIYQSTWQYRKNSVTVDSVGFVWVEITFSQPVNGYSTGWILVKDSLGNYFTNPMIDP